MPELPLYQVDAFTERPFSGNPAAVCLLESPAEEEWMQQVAAEMNLSETAFVVPHEEGFGLRWFTPTTEVPLCGHASLASAHVLWEAGRLEPQRGARFHTRSGVLEARREGDRIALDLPASRVAACAPPRPEAEALGVSPLRCFETLEHPGYLLELGSEAEVREARPDFDQLRRIARGELIVTARGAGEFDFVSRFFAVHAGIDEDPVTGAAHCVLVPFWSARLDKEDLVGFQASARGGVVRGRVRGERVELRGSAVTVFRGALLV